jgi:integrase
MRFLPCRFHPDGPSRPRRPRLVLSLILNEAVEDRPTATPAQVQQIAARIPRPVDQAPVITAAYTGMRWGELAGLSRDAIAAWRTETWAKVRG